MHWDWHTLQATPAEVREYAWAFIQMERQAAAARADKGKQESERQRGVVRVAR